MAAEPAVPAYNFDLFARYYDWDTAAETDDVDFYLNLAARTGGPILDVACGTGRISLPLAHAGYRVVGVDVAPAMLARAREKAAAANLDSRLHLVAADMRAFDLRASFPLAVVALNSFMHLREPADQRRALRCFHQHLRPDGRLVLDLFSPDPVVLAEADGRVVHDYTRPGPGAGAMTSRFHTQRVDATSQSLDVVFFYDEVGADGLLRRTVAPFSMTYLARREVDLLLASTGFAIENVFGDYTLDDYDVGSPKLIVVARRC